MNSRIFVILLNWNGWKDTVECLESLLCSEGVEFVTVVCDNGSEDDSLDQLRSWAGRRFAADEWVNITRSEAESSAELNRGLRFILIENSANLGFAGGNNVGIRLAMSHADCRYVWVLNNDTIVRPDSLIEALCKMERDSSIGMCGSSLVYWHDQSLVQAYGGARYNRMSGRAQHLGAFAPVDSIPVKAASVEAELSYVCGAAMLVRRSFIETVGYMHEDYFLYYEEIDWATRGQGHFRLGYAPRSIVYHKEGASIGTDASGGSALSVYYLFRNRMHFTRRFYPRWTGAVLVACICDVITFLLKGHIMRARAAMQGIISRPLARNEK